MYDLSLVFSDRHGRRCRVCLCVLCSLHRFWRQSSLRTSRCMVQYMFGVAPGGSHMKAAQEILWFLLGPAFLLPCFLFDFGEIGASSAESRPHRVLICFRRREEMPPFVARGGPTAAGEQVCREKVMIVSLLVRHTLVPGGSPAHPRDGFFFYVGVSCVLMVVCR